MEQPATREATALQLTKPNIFFTWLPEDFLVQGFFLVKVFGFWIGSEERIDSGHDCSGGIGGFGGFGFLSLQARAAAAFFRSHTRIMDRKREAAIF